MKTKGFWSLLYSGLILGTFGIWIRLLNHDLSAYQQIAFRNFIGFFLVIGFLLLRKTKLSFNNVSPKYIILYAFSFPLSVIFFTLSILLTKIAVTVFALYIGSILSAVLIGKFLFKEKITEINAISIALLFIGLIFFSMPFSVDSLSLGLLFGLLSGLFESIANAFRKYLGGKVDKFILVACLMVGGVIIAFLFMLFARQPMLFLSQLSSSDWIIGIIFGVLLLAMYYFTLVGFQNIDLHIGTVIVASELIFAPLFGMLVFKEYPTVFQTIGGMCVLLAVILPNIDFGKVKLRIISKG